MKIFCKKNLQPYVSLLKQYMIFSNSPEERTLHHCWHSQTGTVVQECQSAAFMAHESCNLRTCVAHVTTICLASQWGETSLTQSMRLLMKSYRDREGNKGITTHSSTASAQIYLACGAAHSRIACLAWWALWYQHVSAESIFKISAVAHSHDTQTLKFLYQLHWVSMCTHRGDADSSIVDLARRALWHKHESAWRSFIQNVQYLYCCKQALAQSKI